MSICLAPLLAELSAATATSPMTSAAALPVSTYVWAMAQIGLVLAMGVVIYWGTYGRNGQTWAPPRVTDRRTGGPLWVGGAVMVWLFMAVPTFLVVASHESAATRAAGSDGTMVAITALTYLSGLIIVGLMHAAWRRGQSASMLGLRTFSPGKAIVSAAIALPLTYLVAAGSLLVWQLLQVRHESSHAMLQLMERNEASPWVLWVTILNATLLAPVFEEVLFRGHLQTALTAALPKSRWPAILMTAALFAMMHDGWTMPAMFALSVAIGVAYEWSGSLWVAIAIHVAFNATSTLNFLTGH